MSFAKIGFPSVVSLAAAALLGACEGSASTTSASDVQVQGSALTAAQRLAACAQDPRVVAGLASQQICAGANIFFHETFGGNGRTCGTCHPARHNPRSTRSS